MAGRTLRITQVNNRFVLETPDSRTHILGLKALKWNLKHVFGFTGLEVLSVTVMLSTNQKPGYHNFVDLEVA